MKLDDRKELIEEISTLKNKLELAREDLECVHLFLDELGSERVSITGREISVVGRIRYLILNLKMKNEEDKIKFIIGHTAFSSEGSKDLDILNTSILDASDLKKEK
jgi:hypothetical protein